ncbi:MAG: endolytic transglycosylase MltG, partial [Parcubacteria group bacterium]|nr:endolytic transglycosylase MltG [Parcubacteria group bacterium]
MTRQKIFIGIGMVLCAALLAFVGTLSYVHSRIRARGPLDNAQTLHIEKGWGVEQIANELTAQGFIEHPLMFQYAVWRRGLGSDLRAGEYDVPASVSIDDIITLLAGEAGERDISVTFPEGLTLRDYNQRLQERNLPHALETIRAAHYQDSHPLFSQLPRDMLLEGFLFPDTYRFRKES